MQKIAPGIYVITEETGFKLMKPPVNIYALPGEDGLIYDSGYGNRKYTRQLVRELGEIARSAGRESVHDAFSRVLISHAHPDHFSGLSALRRATGVPIALTPQMAAVISSSEDYKKSYQYSPGVEHDPRGPFRRIFRRFSNAIMHLIYMHLYKARFVPDPDIILEDDAEILVNGEKWLLIPSPGHARDHISLYNKKRGILLAGDNILRSKTSWLGPPKSDLREYISTMRRLKELPNLKLILSAHGSPITKPRERIDEIIDWRLKRIDDVCEAIHEKGDAGITLRELFKRLYPGEGPLKFYVVEGWMRLTLKYLRDVGRIIPERGRKMRYYPAP